MVSRLKNIIFLLLFIAKNNAGISQSPCDNIVNVCSFTYSQKVNLDSLFDILNLVDPQTIYKDNTKCQRAIEHILCLNDMDVSPFISYPYGEYNACAAVCNNKKYIFYNSPYLEDATKGNKAALYAILAHEIAHHINGDAWVTDSATLHSAELAADFFAGKLLGRLNMPLGEGLISYNLTNETSTNTHPARIQRIQSFSNGWYEGQLIKFSPIRIRYDANCSSNIFSNFKLEIDNNTIKKNLFTGKKSFSVYLYSEKEESLKSIRKVIYYLHPETFENRIVAGGSLHNKFNVRLNIYGNFELRASVYLNDGSELLLVRKLKMFDESKNKL